MADTTLRRLIKYSSIILMISVVIDGLGFGFLLSSNIIHFVNLIEGKKALKIFQIIREMGFMLLILSWLIKIFLAAYIIYRYSFMVVEDPPEASAPKPQHRRSLPPTPSPIRRSPQALPIPRPILPYPLERPPSPASHASDHGDEMPDYGADFGDRDSGRQEQPVQLPNVHSSRNLTGVSEESDQDTYGLRQREPSRSRIRSIEEISSTTRELVEPAEAAKNSEGSRSSGGESMGQPRSPRIRKIACEEVRAIIDEENKNLGEKKSSSDEDSNCTSYITASTSAWSLEETYYETGEHSAP